MPLLEANLRLHDLPNPYADRMRGVQRYWWSRNQVLLARLGLAVRTLEDHGIRTMLLKGAALVATGTYRDPGLRPMNDADLLVPRDAALETVRLLAPHGWHSEREVTAETVRRLHGVSLNDASGRTIDLHWAIHEDDCRPDSDLGVWGQARNVSLRGASTLAPAPSSLLLHAMAHGAKWARDPSVYWVADAITIVATQQVEWQAFVAEARRRHFVVRMRACLAYLAAAFQVPVPETVMADLAAAPVSAFERLEHQVRVHRHPLLGELPRYWFAHARTAPMAEVVSPIAFGRYLQQAWRVPALRDVPRAAAHRTVNRVRYAEGSQAVPTGD